MSRHSNKSRKPIIRLHAGRFNGKGEVHIDRAAESLHVLRPNECRGLSHTQPRRNERVEAQAAGLGVRFSLQQNLWQMRSEARAEARKKKVL